MNVFPSHEIKRANLQKFLDAQPPKGRNTGQSWPSAWGISLSCEANLHSTRKSWGQRNLASGWPISDFRIPLWKHFKSFQSFLTFISHTSSLSAPSWPGLLRCDYCGAWAVNTTQVAWLQYQQVLSLGTRSLSLWVPKPQSSFQDFSNISGAMVDHIHHGACPFPFPISHLEALALFVGRWALRRLSPALPHAASRRMDWCWIDPNCDLRTFFLSMPGLSNNLTSQRVRDCHKA